MNSRIYILLYKNNITVRKLLFRLRPCDHSCNDLINKAYEVAPLPKNSGCDPLAKGCDREKGATRFVDV